jgi:hypothetical protein
VNLLKSFIKTSVIFSAGFLIGGGYSITRMRAKQIEGSVQAIPGIEDAIRRLDEARSRYEESRVRAFSGK